MTCVLPLLAVALLLTGCETLVLALDESLQAQRQQQTDTAPRTDRTTRLAVTITGFEALNDCDGVEGVGEFNYWIDSRSSFASSASGEVRRGSAQLSDGQRTGALGRRVFEGPAVDGQTLSIVLRANEMDKPVIGAARPDSRLNNTSRTATHAFRNGRWENVGARYITLGGGNCRVRLHYTLDQLS